MNLIFSRATEAIDIGTMKHVAENAAGALGITHQLIMEPFGDYSADAILQRLSDLQQRYLDEQDAAVIFVLFDEHAIEFHGATVLGRAVAQSRVAVVRWRTDPEITAATSLHELGHIFGLTNRHCDREDCIMYPYARAGNDSRQKGTRTVLRRLLENNQQRHAIRIGAKRLADGCWQVVGTTETNRKHNQLTHSSTTDSSPHRSTTQTLPHNQRLLR